MLNDLEENRLTTDTFLFLHMKIMTMFTESVMQILSLLMLMLAFLCEVVVEPTMT